MKTTKLGFATLALLVAGCTATVAPTDTPDDDDDDENIGSTAQAYSVSTYNYSLAWHGGSGGSWTGPLGCGVGDLIVGLQVRTGTYVDRVDLICAKLHADGTFGPRYTSGGAGGGGGTARTIDCGAGYAAAGVEGRSWTYLDAIALRCARPGRNPDHYTSLVGGGGGALFGDYCPTGYLLRSLEMRTGNIVDAIRANCVYIQP